MNFDQTFSKSLEQAFSKSLEDLPCDVLRIVGRHLGFLHSHVFACVSRRVRAAVREDCVRMREERASRVRVSCATLHPRTTFGSCSDGVRMVIRLSKFSSGTTRAFPFHNTDKIMPGATELDLYIDGFDEDGRLTRLVRSIGSYLYVRSQIKSQVWESEQT